MNELMNFLQAVYSNDISRAFGLAIGAFFVFGITNLNSQSGKTQAIIHHAPSAMTSLGILGTFFGIFIGLQDFNIDKIDESVPELLEGLKVAFASSILGVAAALSFRFLKPILQSETVQKASDTDVVTDLLERIAKATEQTSDTENVTGLLERITEATERTGEYLGNDEHNRGTIIGQISGLRHDLRVGKLGTEEFSVTPGQRLLTVQEKVSELEYAFRGYAHRSGNEHQNFMEEFRALTTNLSAAFSENLTEELRQVIQELNQNIVDQFGENFEHLNQAFIRLIEWQENYKDHIDIMNDAFQDSLNGINETKNAIEAISAASSSIPDTMDALRNTVEGFAQQSEQLNEQLSALAQMRAEAAEVFSHIGEHLQGVVGTIEESANQFGGLGEHVEQAITNLSEQISQTLADSQASQENMLEQTREQFNNTVAQATQQLNEALNTLDEAMQERIASSITEMAQNLTGITQQLVDDYAPLLQATNDLISTATQAQNNAH